MATVAIPDQDLLKLERVLNDVLSGDKPSMTEVARLLADVQSYVVTSVPAEHIPAYLKWMPQIGRKAA